MQHHEPGLSVVMSRTASHRHSRHRHVGRRPNIRTLVMQFEKAGKRVTSITTPDGVTVRFCEPGKDISNNDLDEWMAKRNARPA